MNSMKKCSVLLLFLYMAGSARAQWIVAHCVVVSPNFDTTWVKDQFPIVNDCIIDPIPGTGPYLTVVFQNIKAECLPSLMSLFPDANLVQFALDTLDNSYLQAIMNLDAKLNYIEIICRYGIFSKIGQVHLDSLMNLDIFTQSGLEHEHAGRRVIKRIARGRPGFAGALNGWTYFR